MSKLTIAVTMHDHLQGDSSAPCSLVEYGDYQCPACGEVQPILKKLQSDFGKQLSLVFRNFPLRAIHPWAEPAAEVAEYAGRHGAFWEMHDLLFAHQASLNKDTFRDLAESLGLIDFDSQFARSITTSKERIAADFAGGIRSGVNGTPTFFLNGDRYDGPTDYRSLVKLMEQVLIGNGD